MREAWADALSHRFRTPMTSIYGGTQLLLRHVVSPTTQAAIIGDIAAEAEQLSRLVEDLLAVVRLPAGSRLQDRRPVRLHEVAAEAARDEERRWPGRRVVIDANPAVPVVDGDADYLRHLLRNLISNAIKFSRSDRPVEVEIDQVDDEVLARVLDRGPGFPAGAGDDVFSLFHRSPGTAARLPGAGIGLYVARALVEAHGGRIWTKVRPDGGTEVGFALTAR